MIERIFDFIDRLVEMSLQRKANKLFERSRNEESRKRRKTINRKS